ncbi:RNA-directed DNA polymerase (reverse transcriptase)-related family protein [Rhynchospora pubera]|uniref:RNA-directed DNA polymerase (Reverse transcriptase)-related family protein n=1 Tax=Rhynchospora pubera TaxID=906938 RepID=A0AAV8GP29_9POAL|nr:RNA-directed DNA polymerase (reverse transcriptase)-related family protein [Rhynchospora pubera]
MMQAAALTSHEHLSPALTEPFYILQYADDTLFFCTAKGQAPRTLLLVLDNFSKVSGMAINMAKSSFVPFNLSDQNVVDLKVLLGCSSTTLPIQYLGLPLSASRPNRQTFQLLIDKLTRRLAGWKAKLLSRAGRLVLAASVLSTIPIFFMSVFKLHVWVVRAMDRLRRDFLWKGTTVPARGVHLLSWDRVCLPKNFDGFGLLNLSLHNLCLLLRWWWRIYDKPFSQWGSITKLLYHHSGRSMPPLAWKQSGSFFWKDLRKLRSLFQLSLTQEIHNGEGSLFWFDNWSGSSLCFFDYESSVPHKHITVKAAIPILNQLLPSPISYNESQACVVAQNLQLSQGKDKLLWKWRKDGNYSTASVYKSLISAGKCKFSFKNIWKLKVPPSVHLFLVLLAHDRILTQDQLQKRNIPFQPKCVMCGNFILETRHHLFEECGFAVTLWSQLHLHQATLLSLLHSLCTPSYGNKVTLATAMWGLWLERNNRIFKDEHRPLDVVLQWIIQQATLFRNYC